MLVRVIREEGKAKLRLEAERIVEKQSMVDEKLNDLTSGNYNITVENFGPIVRADVDLRPLTVFIGPSNTGKSYLAILIYALHQFFGAASGPFYWHRARFRRRRLSLPALRTLKSSVSTQESLANWLGSVLEKNRTLPLPKDVDAAIRPILERPRVEEQLEAELRRCFGMDDLSGLVRFPGSRSIAKIALAIPQGTKSQAVRYGFEFGQGKPHFSGEIPFADLTIGEEISGDLYFEAQRLARIDESESSEEDEFLDSVWSSLIHHLFQLLTRPLSHNAFYLPADRTGVMHSHQVVVSTLIQNATTAGLRPSADVPMLSGVLADFLNDLILLSERRLPRSSVRLAEALERMILEGVIRLNRDHASYPVFTYRPTGWKSDLPLMRTSSMVSELAPVVLYLRHLVRPGNLLIIEEPESHLHPEMQAVFARELVRLVRSGIRVIMTTHSEWFLEQLGNLVRLGMLPKEKRQRSEDANYALLPEEIGAWLFNRKQRPRGTLVGEITLDPETGLFPTGFDLVSEALYNEGADLFSRLQESPSE